MRLHWIIFKKMASLSIENQFQHEFVDFHRNSWMLFEKKKRIVFHLFDVLFSIEIIKWFKFFWIQTNKSRKIACNLWKIFAKTLRWIFDRISNATVKLNQINKFNWIKAIRYDEMRNVSSVWFTCNKLC